MNKYYVENEKYIIKSIEENDKENVRKFFRDDMPFKELLNIAESAAIIEATLDDKFTYMKCLHCLVLKETEEICGMIDISPEDDCGEGEVSITLKDETDICEVVNLLGNIFQEMGYKKTKNLTVEYSLE